MKIFFFIIFIIIPVFGQAQSDELNKIVDRGYDLYAIEKCNWISTDTILKYYNDTMNITGYLSYIDSTNIKSIYWNKNNEVLFTFLFKDSIMEWEYHKRLPTSDEKELIEKRTFVREMIYSKKTGKYFKKYPNTSFNIVPFKENNSIIVYVMTGTYEREVVPIGNDYMISFDQFGAFEKQRIHRSYLPLSTSGILTMHTHVDGSCLSETDVCILLLYKDMIKWDSHIIMGKTCTITWDIKNGCIKKN
jgi:hypothetical protein